MADLSPYSGHASAPNRHYSCSACGRDLWTDRRRFRNPHNAPAIFRDGERTLCQRCFGEDSPADALCALWVDEAPRFGAVAAHFPESLRKRPFVASFWAPEVSLFGWWYLGLGMGRNRGQRGGVISGNTRAGLDVGFSGAIEIAGEPCHPGCTPPRKHLLFWSPELPEVLWHPTEGRFFTRQFDPAAAVSVWGVVWTLLLLLVLAPPAGAQTLFGVVSRVTDGDTLVVGGARIRLFGIDAPESRQECRNAKGTTYACGYLAEVALSCLAPAGSSISCQIKDVDRYGRLVAVCSVASRAGSDLSREMVLAGWAVAYRKYSDRYVAEEAAAKNGKRGMWAGSFQQPEDWRKGVRQ